MKNYALISKKEIYLFHRISRKNNLCTHAEIRSMFISKYIIRLRRRVQRVQILNLVAKHCPVLVFLATLKKNLQMIAVSLQEVWILGIKNKKINNHNPLPWRLRMQVKHSSGGKYLQGEGEIQFSVEKSTGWKRYLVRTQYPLGTLK